MRRKINVELLGARLREIQDNVEKIRGVARFRNILVLRYWNVDPQRVLLYARENPGDFEAYNEQIVRFIARQAAET
jgi:uncharacterized protein YutE (UPF0331/DUF86 family)